LGDDVVLETLEFKVVARPSDCWAECGRESGGGVYVEPGAFNRILAPLPVPKRLKAEVETGEEENDDDLESDGDLKCASDLSDPGGVLDTDVESAGEAFESGSEPDDKASVPHAADGASPASDARGAEDEVLAKPSAKTARPPLWDNGYFYITDNSAQNDGTVKIIMYGAWEKQPPPVGMGMKPQRSKTFTVSSFDGWERSSHARAFLLLRAWMLGRFA